MNAVVEPVRHKLSVDDFIRMGEAGIFAHDARIELLEGELIDMPPIGSSHMSVTNRLNRLLVRGAGDDAIVSVANPVKLPPWSMPQPDFLLLRPCADDYASAYPGSGDTLLAIEVAESSLRFDRNTKARVYAQHGIPEYWMIEASARRLHRYRQPSPESGSWASVQLLEAPFSLSPAALPALTLSSDGIWPPG